MHVDIGTLVWVGLVLFGVISSMVKNARSAGARPAPRASAPQHVLASVHGAAAAPPAPAPVQPAPEMPQPPPVVVLAPDAPKIVRRPITIPQADAKPSPAPAWPAATLDAGVHGTAPVRGMFARRADLVRAMIASQVLGPPKALQEHSIWSPRHDEAST